MSTKPVCPPAVNLTDERCPHCYVHPSHPHQLICPTNDNFQTSPERIRVIIDADPFKRRLAEQRQESDGVAKSEAIASLADHTGATLRHLRRFHDVSGCQVYDEAQEAAKRFMEAFHLQG